jgi:tRNA G10  N-methylase Trm11
MRTFLQLANTNGRVLPSRFRDDDVRYADSLVAHFIEEWTSPGDVVFDPFAGFGTTLLVAESLGRVPVGLEYDPDRVAYIAGELQDPQAIKRGDARQLSHYNLPPFDLCITSPPYMQKGDPEDPLAAYTEQGNGYAAYLDGLRDIYFQVARLMKPAAHVIIEAANLKGDAGVTTLAWDIARSVSEVLRFEGEIVVGWDRYGSGYDHSYCLVFTHLGKV